MPVSLTHCLALVKAVGSPISAKNKAVLTEPKPKESNGAASGRAKKVSIRASHSVASRFSKRAKSCRWVWIATCSASVSTKPTDV